jgi:hypothetical protein
VSLTIERASNGYILRESDSEDPRPIVVEETDRVDATYALLGRMLEQMGHSGSRYDERRVRIVIEPGDKWEPPA